MPANDGAGLAPPGWPRYQYAGAFGYESGLIAVQGADTSLPPITLQHLGHRWYQPDIGRFVQRDPIGIAGGLNVYGYVSSASSYLVDPSGQQAVTPPSGIPPITNVPLRHWLRPGFWGTRLTLGQTTTGSALGWVSAAAGAGTLVGNSLVQYTDIEDHVAGCLWWFTSPTYTPGYNPLGTQPAPAPSPPYSPPGGRELTIPCFVADTAVLTLDGLKPIQDLTDQDLVYTTKEPGSTDVRLARIVWAGQTGVASELILVVVAGEVVTCTPDHPFWVLGRGWVIAAELEAGAILDDGYSSSLPCVEKVIRLRAEPPVPVYDIRVEGMRWFRVTPLGLLVHNT